MSSTFIPPKMNICGARNKFLTGPCTIFITLQIIKACGSLAKVGYPSAKVVAVNARFVEVGPVVSHIGEILVFSTHIYERPECTW